MSKINYGSITNMAGETKNIEVVNKLIPIKDYIIGIGIITTGVIYMLSKSFKYGADSFEQAEFNTMKDLHIID